MTQLEINGSDSTTLHLFHLDLPPEAVERFTTMAGTGEWPLKYALGASALRPAFVETLDLRDLGPMSLSQYLSQAHDIGAQALGGDKARLDALKGHVIVLPPQAFDGNSQTLAVATPLAHVGSYSATPSKPRGAALKSASAFGQGGGGAPATAGQGRSAVLKYILVGVALMILATLVMVL